MNKDDYAGSLSEVKWAWGDASEGGIQVKSGGKCWLNDTTVTEGRSHNIYIDGGEAYLDNTIIEKSGQGGSDGHGILVSSSSKLEMTGGTIDDIDEYGIETSSRINVTGVTINDADDGGIKLLGGAALSKISGGNITNTTYGVTISGNNMEISNNDFKSISTDAVYIYQAHFVEVSNNDIDTSSSRGVYAYQSYELDINNNTIEDPTHGVYLEECNNSLVADNTIDDCTDGVKLYHSDDNTVTDNDMTLDTRGIFCSLSDDNTITGNTIDNCTSEGILVSDSDGNLVEYNNVTDCNYGIQIHETTAGWTEYNDVNYNDFYSNDEYGIYVDANNNNFTVNNITHNTKDGIYVYNADHIVLRANAISDNDHNGIKVSSGSAHNNTIKYNNITDAPEDYYGLYLYNGDDNTIQGNNITSNWRGVKLYSSEDNSFIDNNISSNTWYGVYMENSDGNSFLGDDVLTNYDGFWAKNANHTTLTNVSITIRNPTGGDIILELDSHFTTLNSSFDESKVDFIDRPSELTVQWYLHVNVGTASAGVVVENKTTYTVMQTGNTSGTGYLKWLVLEEYTDDKDNAPVYCRDYTIYSFKNGVGAARTDIDMDQTKTQSVTLTTLSHAADLAITRDDTNDEIDLAWSTVSNTRLYRIYKSTDRDTWTWTSGYYTTRTLSWSNETHYDDEETWYYLVRAWNGVEGWTNSVASVNSTMALKFDKRFDQTPNAVGTYDYYMSLPYNTAYDCANDIATELTDTNATPIGKWNNATQTVNMYSYIPGQGWLGTNFTINPGDGLFISVNNSNGFNWVIVGTDVNSTQRFDRTPNAIGTYDYWMSLGGTSNYTNATDIADELTESKTRVIGRWNNATQTVNTYSYIPGPGWLGTPFEINPGDGIRIGVHSNFIWDVNPVTWPRPDDYYDETGGGEKAGGGDEYEIVMSFSGPQPDKGDEITIYATVYNNADKALKDVTVGFYTLPDLTFLAWKNISQLDPGKSTIVSIQYTVAQTIEKFWTFLDDDWDYTTGTLANDCQGIMVNLKPIADYDITQDGKDAMTYNFDASDSYDPDGIIFNYTWDLDDGTIKYGKTIEHKYTSTGTYEVELTVTDNSGATGVKVKKLTV